MISIASLNGLSTYTWPKVDPFAWNFTFSSWWNLYTPRHCPSLTMYATDGWVPKPAVCYPYAGWSRS